jgi:hypothetical protein
MKTIHLTLFLMLILMGTPTLINYLFFNTFHPPDLFPFYSYKVIPVEPSDHIITVENGSFRPQEDPFTTYIGSFENSAVPVSGEEMNESVPYVFENGSIITLDHPLFFTTRVEVKAQPFSLDASQIVELNYYWLCMDKNGFPFGDYYAGLEYLDVNSNVTVDEVLSQLIHAEGISQIREYDYEYGYPYTVATATLSIPASNIPQPGSGFQLPKASQDEYVFKLVAYMNATVKQDEPVARFVLVYKYKSSITIMGHSINLETIGYMALLSPFAILAAALMFQKIRRRRNRFHGSTNLVAEKLFSGPAETK